MTDSSAVTWRFEAIGTVWEIVTAVPLPDAARERIGSLVAEFDRVWSRFRADSTVTALAQGGSVPPPPDSAVLLDTYVELDAATAGAVNPLIGDALARRGYDASYSLVDRGAQPTVADWRSVVEWDAERLTLHASGTLDVGAIGKGRLADLVAAEVSRWTAVAVVDASGDIVVRGPATRIGLEHPFDPTRAIGVATVGDAALCASAVNRRTWGDGLHHVLDARTGRPVRTVAATWAIADTAMRADAISTALFFDGGPELAARWGVEWVRMTTDGRVEWSAGDRVEMFR